MGQLKSEMTSCQRILLWTVILTIALIMLILGIVLTIRGVKDSSETTTEKPKNPATDPPTKLPPATSPTDPLTTPPPNEIKSEFGQFRHAAVSSDAIPCSAIGNDIMAKYKGSVVDAAIATMICVGVVNLHSTGIGGGHFMTIYATPKNGTEKVFNNILGRERAPANATEDMYVNGTASSTYGGMAIGIPGEIKGYHHAWMKYGRLPWKKLIEPSIELCKVGTIINKHASNYIVRLEEKIRNDPDISELIVKPDGTLLQEGDVVTRPKLARTLSIIADDPTAYYDPSKQLAQDIVADIQDAGGIITLDDLANYEVYDKEPLAVHLSNGNYTVYGPRPPSGGIVLQYILGILNGYYLTAESISDTESKVLTYHRMAEAYKFAYAKRTLLADEEFLDIEELIANMTSEDFAKETRLKVDDSKTYGFDHYEPEFEQEDHSGTAHGSFLGPDGSAVSVTSSINYIFGSFVRGSRTGIIFNNQMDDFSTPGLINSFGFRPSPANFIKPGKMPLSSMSPIIVVDGEGKVVHISGASGGSRIITAVSFVAMHTLWLGMRIDAATDLARVHHQLVPNKLQIDDGFDQAVLDGLIAKGHNITSNGAVQVQSIRNYCDGSFKEEYYDRAHCIDAAVDFRKAGKPDGF